MRIYTNLHHLTQLIEIEWRSSYVYIRTLNVPVCKLMSFLAD